MRTAVTLITLSAGATILTLSASGTATLPWPVNVYAAMGTVAFVAVAVDKRKARLRRRRVPEATLHALEFVGGWVGSLVAQLTFRHKVRKFSYQIVFWLIGLAHGGAWLAWCQGWAFRK